MALSRSRQPACAAACSVGPNFGLHASNISIKRAGPDFSPKSITLNHLVPYNIQSSSDAAPFESVSECAISCLIPCAGSISCAASISLFIKIVLLLRASTEVTWSHMDNSKHLWTSNLRLVNCLMGLLSTFLS